MSTRQEHISQATRAIAFMQLKLVRIIEYSLLKSRDALLDSGMASLSPSVILIPNRRAGEASRMFLDANRFPMVIPKIDSRSGFGVGDYIERFLTRAGTRLLEMSIIGFISVDISSHSALIHTAGPQTVKRFMTRSVGRSAGFKITWHLISDKFSSSSTRRESKHRLAKLLSGARQATSNPPCALVARLILAWSKMKQNPVWKPALVHHLTTRNCISVGWPFRSICVTQLRHACMARFSASLFGAEQSKLRGSLARLSRIIAVYEVGSVRGPSPENCETRTINHLNRCWRGPSFEVMTN